MFVPGNNLLRTGVFACLLIVCINLSFCIRNKLKQEIDLWDKKYEKVLEDESFKNMEAMNETD